MRDWVSRRGRSYAFAAVGSNQSHFKVLVYHFIKKVAVCTIDPCPPAVVDRIASNAFSGQMHEIVLAQRDVLWQPAAEADKAVRTMSASQGGLWVTPDGLIWHHRNRLVPKLLSPRAHLTSRFEDGAR